MGVAENTNVRMRTIQERSSLFGELSTFVQNVADGNPNAGQLDHCLTRKSASFILIDITGNGGDWSNRLELLDHGLPTDVACVNDMIDTTKMLLEHRIKESMGIRQNTDTKCT